MKIAVRGGHNHTVPGASGIIDEVQEDRKMKDAVIKYLRAAGHDVLDVTSPDSCGTVGSDLSYGVNKANNWGADLFLSFHFNNAYNHYEGAIGSEVCVYRTSQRGQRIVDALAGLGFKNRGQKVRTGLYELRMPSMESMIIETCFVEATEDVAIYRKHGVDTIAKTIVEAALNTKVNGSVSTSTSQPHNSGSSSSGSARDSWVLSLQKELNLQFGAGLSEDGYAGPATLSACVLCKKGAKGNLTRLIQKRLISFGYSVGIYGADGMFGDSTVNAVKKLQSDHKLTADGMVGRNTWAKLLKL